jgi:unsaturated rhamnogalacturonyl hydrolase
MTVLRQLGRLLLAGSLAGGMVAASATSPAAAATTRFEAETATISHGTVASNHSGFTGSGFVDYENSAGSFVEFAVSEPAVRLARLTFRFANGTSANRSMTITVNGATVSTNLGFTSTSAWTTWQTQVIVADLVAGTNLIRATAATANGGPNLDSLTVDDSVGSTDWSTAVVNSTMARSSPANFGGWGYTQGLYLWAQYLVWQRTHSASYLQYIRDWVDRFVDSGGNIDNSFNNLDSMQSGNVLLALFKETGQAKYRTAAMKIRTRLNTYPTTSDGGFWHGTSREHQLWGDGTFMVLPFLARYGQIVGDTTFANDTTARQLIIYYSHLQSSIGLLFHAYDESRNQSWADPDTGVSPLHWCRAIGWFGMATTEVLEALPADHPQRPQLVSMIRTLVSAFARYQDPATGRWFQVVDMGSRSDNWTETSCSSMYTYVTSRAVERGYVDPSFAAVASRGYRGVLATVSLGSDGRTNITDICVGTNVSDSYTFYIGRTRATNDLHGLGAFLLMSEQLRRVGG